MGRILGRSQNLLDSQGYTCESAKGTTWLTANNLCHLTALFQKLTSVFLDPGLPQGTSELSLILPGLCGTRRQLS